MLIIQGIAQTLIMVLISLLMTLFFADFKPGKNGKNTEIYEENIVITPLSRNHHHSFFYIFSFKKKCMVVEYELDYTVL